MKKIIHTLMLECINGGCKFGEDLYKDSLIKMFQLIIVGGLNTIKSTKSYYASTAVSVGNLVSASATKCL